MESGGTGPLSQRSTIANFVADFLQRLGLGLGLVSVIVTGSYSLYPVQSTLDLCDSGPEPSLGPQKKRFLKITDQQAPNEELLPTTTVLWGLVQNRTSPEWFLGIGLGLGHSRVLARYDSGLDPK